MTLDPTKYLTPAQTTQLREFWRLRASEALKNGRIGAVKTWMIVDLALSTENKEYELDENSNPIYS